MKIFNLIFISLLLAGCITPIPYTNEEKCALDNMRLTGINKGFAVINTHVNGTYNDPMGYSATSKGQSENIQCMVPNTSLEKEEISVISKKLQPKTNFNQDIKQKQIINALGYVPFFPAGIVLYYYYNLEKEKAITEYNQNLILNTKGAL